MLRDRARSSSRRVLALLVLGSVLLSLAAAELAWRGTADDVELFTFRNFALARLSLYDSAYPSTHDPLLGWIPEPGYEGLKDNVWKTRVHIDDDGFRSNGRTPPPGPAILAVGDSFTFGDEVDDDATFPSRLEARLGRRVVNAGVFGYGLDQSVLRGERYLDEAPRPAAVVLQAVRDDVVRMQMRVRTGVEKPYFTIVDDALRLEGTPTSRRRPAIADVGPLRRTLGYSYLVDWTMRRLGYAEWWYLGTWSNELAYEDLERATSIACRLVTRFGARLREDGVTGVFVAQYAKHVLELSPYEHEYLRPLTTVVGCARASGFRIVDTHPLMRPIAQADPARFAGFYRAVHFSRAGNEALAAYVAEVLTSTTP